MVGVKGGRRENCREGGGDGGWVVVVTVVEKNCYGGRSEISRAGGGERKEVYVFIYFMSMI